PTARIELHAEGELDGSFDPDRLMQVLSNLIGNAVQHGEPDASVIVELDGTRPEVLRASVSNVGHLPPSLIPQLFTPFHRSEGRDVSGLGLGLYIVDQFVRAHGGTVTARSEGRRTVFEVQIPRAVSRAA